MELRHLRYFEALAHRLSFTRAAEQVHVTQPTLSHQIGQLEAELGVRLFHRIGRRVALSEAGELLLPHVTRALQVINDGVSEARGATRQASAVLRLASTPTFNLGVMPACLAACLARRPDALIRVDELHLDEMVRLLRAGELDLSVTFGLEGATDLPFEPLYREEMVLAVSSDHPFAGRRRVRMVELHRQALVLLPERFGTRRMLDAWFCSVGAEPLIVAEMNAVGPMMELVSRSSIAAIVSQHASERDGIRLLPLEDPTPIRVPGLLWPAGAERPALAREFAAIVRETLMSRRWGL